MDDREFFTKELRPRLITLKGTKCANCLSECNDEIIFHHVVPLILGGTNNYSNIVGLCTKCHNIIHFNKENNKISHSELTKKGIEKARAAGKHIGGVKGKKLDVKKAGPAKEIIKKYNKSFGGDYTNEQTAKLANIALNTFYKYKNEILAELREKEKES